MTFEWRRRLWFAMMAPMTRLRFHLERSFVSHAHGFAGCLAVALMLTALGQHDRPADGLPPVPVSGLAYTNAFFPGATYRADVPTQESLIGFAAGERASTAAEIERCLKAWNAVALDRTRLVEYARSHENRPLHYLLVTAPANLARLDQIQSGLARLGDPRGISDVDARGLIDTLPAVAWLAHTIHGDETEGSDAALALAYHLVAAEDSMTAQLLANLVIIIDPLMNPDGRDRFVKMIAEHRGALPNLDDQSLVHEGYWPYGRGNHYLFDLNRDWALGVHPETRGRIREVSRWNPQLFVDAHGMGSQATHLFSPPREPVNPNIPAGRADWGLLFARDQARAMDRIPFLYFTGEWHEEWYPGYSDGWSSCRGAVGILYEQARVAEDGVRRPGGRLLSYRESVHHHIVGAMANLETLERNARQLREYFYQTRKAALDPGGPYGQRTFAIPPTANQSRLAALVDLLRLQGIELHQATAGISAPRALDQLGRERQNCALPAGTLLIPNRQPLAHLVSALLEFDPHFTPQSLAEERKELLRFGRSRIYDTTAWNLTMLFGLEAFTLPTDLPEGTKPFDPPSKPAAILDEVDAPVAFVFDGADDHAVTAAARLMERGIQVRASDKSFRFDGRDFARGSIVVTRLDNRDFSGNWREMIERTAMELGLPAAGLTTGLGEGDLPDLGGRHFRRLEPPRIGVLARGRFSSTDYGSIWQAIDQHLGIRHSHLEIDGNPGDLSRYNVLIVPETWSALPTGLLDGLKEWVRGGGTLIAVAASVNAFVAPKAEFSRVRLLGDVLDRLPEYELAILREWEGSTGVVPPLDEIWRHVAKPDLEYPWQTVKGAHPDEKELRKREAWQSLFMPQGAFLAARVDTDHWLTAGCGEMLPILADTQPILMAAEGVEAPVRYGHWVAARPANNASAAAGTGERRSRPDPSDPSDPSDPQANATKDTDKKDGKEPARLGWCAPPPDTETYLRMSGLLWPEAAHRLANSACVTRERLGRGQVILFSTSPTFRGATRGPMRIFLNAVVCGPGWGASQGIVP